MGFQGSILLFDSLSSFWYSNVLSIVVKKYLTIWE
jgi:hypothetical protein